MTFDCRAELTDKQMINHGFRDITINDDGVVSFFGGEHYIIDIYATTKHPLEGEIVEFDLIEVVA